MGETNTYELQVEADSKDFWAMIAKITPRVWGHWRPLVTCGILPMLSIILGVLVGTAMLANSDTITLKSAIDSMIASGAVAALSAVLSPLLFNNIIRARVIDKDGSFVEPASVKIDDEGIGRATENFDSFHKWSAVKSFTKTKTSYLLYIDRAEGILIPFRSVTPKHSVEDFEAFISARIATAVRTRQ